MRLCTLLFYGDYCYEKSGIAGPTNHCQELLVVEPSFSTYRIAAACTPSLRMHLLLCLLRHLFPTCTFDCYRTTEVLLYSKTALQPAFRTIVGDYSSYQMQGGAPREPEILTPLIQVLPTSFIPISRLFSILYRWNWFWRRRASQLSLPHHCQKLSLLQSTVSHAGTEYAEHIQIIITFAQEADNMIPTQDLYVPTGITYGSE